MTQNNEAFMYYDRKLSFEELVKNDKIMPIVYMPAVKDRIRWLSRKVDELLTGSKSRDKAIEFAEYMAKSAEHMLECGGAHEAYMASVESGETEFNDVEADHLREVFAESLTGLRSSIYEFRKRKDKAA